VQTGLVLATGELWLFLLQFPLANLCMCALFARTAGSPNPLVARLAAEVVALRQPATCHPGLHRFFQGATWLWAGIFLLLTIALAVLMVTESTGSSCCSRPSAPPHWSSPQPAYPHCGLCLFCAGPG
jgi:uncharacterized membrane protein